MSLELIRLRKTQLEGKSSFFAAFFDEFLYGSIDDLGTDGRWLFGVAKLKDNGCAPVGVDLMAAFEHCGCDHKIKPCRHMANLIAHYLGRPLDFIKAERPEWLVDFIDKKTFSKVVSDFPIISAERLETMQAGGTVLQTWLEDLMRGGLGAMKDVKETAAAILPRIGDSKMTGAVATIERWVFEMSKPENAGLDQKMELTAHTVSELSAFARALALYDSLPSDAWRHELARVAGVTRKKEEVKAINDSYSGRWALVWHQIEKQPYLPFSSLTCLWWSIEHQLFAVEMAYSPFRDALPKVVNGTQIQATMLFYPGLVRSRALPEDPVFIPTEAFEITDPHADFAALQAKHNQIIGKTPWPLPQYYYVLGRAALSKGTIVLTDEMGTTLSVENADYLFNFLTADEQVFLICIDRGKVSVLRAES
jgi:hypothetical protein